MTATPARKAPHAKKAPTKKAASTAKKASSDTRSSEDASTESGPPKYDPAAVGRIVKRVAIDNVELVQAHFEREDAGPIAAAAASEAPLEVGIGTQAEIVPSETGYTLGCLLSFVASPDNESSEWRLFAEFRLTYLVQGHEAVDQKDIDQFLQWNVIFNGWPYWREYLASTVNRAGLPRAVLPVLRVPAPNLD